MSQENFYWDAVFVHVQVKYGIHSNLCLPYLFVRTCVQLPHDCTYLWLIIQKLLLKLRRKTSSLLLASATTPMDMLSFLLFKIGNCHISWDLRKPWIAVKPPHKKGRQLYSPYLNFILLYRESVASNKEFTDLSPRQDNLSCSPPNRKRTNKYTPKPLKEKRRTEKGKGNKYQLQETLFTSDTKCRLLLSSIINTTPVFSPF